MLFLSERQATPAKATATKKDHKVGGKKDEKKDENKDEESESHESKPGDKINANKHSTNF